MKKVIFLYRDASNYKCTVEKEFSDDEVKDKGFKIGYDTTFKIAGVFDDDIQLIQRYGRGDDDHHILEIIEIEEI